MFTFAVVGRNESERLARAVAQAHAAARPGDEVWYVDSGSADSSRRTAAALGVRVLGAPGGKGRAIAAALAELRSEHLVLLDGDIDRTTRNIAAELRRRAEEGDADLVVAEFEEPRLQVRDSSRYVWRPLVGALFPEADGRFGSTPLSGFRALRAGLDLGELPAGFGVETHINLAVAAAGRPFEVVDVGTYWGPVRSKPLLGSEVGAAVLDLAERHGRLDRELRPLWDEWVAAVVDIVIERSTHTAGGAVPLENVAAAGYVARLEAAAERPLPPARAGAAVRPS